MFFLKKYSIICNNECKEGIHMNRESDLQALKNMKEEIVEIYNLSEQCKKLSDEYEELSGKIKSPEPFAFARKPENSEQKLKAVYNKEWENAHKNGGRLWRVPLIINTVIVSVITLIISDYCFKTGLIINSEVLSVFVTSPLDTVINIILSAALAFLLIYAPWRIAGKGT